MYLLEYRETLLRKKKNLEVCAETIKHGCHDNQLKNKVINCKVVAKIGKNLLVCMYCVKIQSH
jgi:hypothetical protein